MRKNLFRRIAVLAWLSTTAFQLNAEGGCPPGQFPQQGQGWRSCIPMGGGSSGSNAPQEIWENHWGALASDKDNNFAGASKGLPTKEAAIASAIADCEAYGGVGCRKNVTYRNQCVAAVSGDKLTDFFAGKTEQAAIKSGMAACESSGQNGCFVVYSGCSLPRRIQ